jgi:hypothetical protein
MPDDKSTPAGPADPVLRSGIAATGSGAHHRNRFGIIQF